MPITTHHALHKAMQAGSRLLMQPWFVPAMLALGLLLPILVHLVVPTAPYSDANWYVQRAQDLVSGLGYQEDGWPTAYWPVGWPAMLAVGLLATDSVPAAILGLNLVATAVTLYCILWLGRQVIADERVARLGLALFAVYPGAVFLATQALTETTYTAISLAAFCALIASKDHPKRALASGLLFGIATLAKPQTLLFPFGVVVAMLLVYPRFGLLRAGRRLIGVYLVLLLVVAPWSLRNYLVFDDFVLVSTNGGTALLIGADDAATGGHIEPQETGFFDTSGFSWDERVQRQVEIDRAQKAAAWDWIATHPAEYLALMPPKVMSLWLKDTYGFWGALETNPGATIPLRLLQALNQVYYLVMLAFAVPCLFVSARALITREPRWLPMALLFCMPLFVSLLAAVFTGQPRYHFPAMPYIMLAAAWGVSRLSQRFEHEPER